MEVVVAVTAAEAAHLAAAHLRTALEDGLARRGRAVLAVSGGTTPAAMFDELAASELDWSGIHLFQVDERVAPDGHPDRNAVLLTSQLIDAAPVPAANVHLMPVTAGDLAAAAGRYASTLRRITGDGVLDAVHLGIGADGHTASWPPGDPVAGFVDAPDAAVVGPFHGRVRMTLTPLAVNRARVVVWLVTGADKQSATTGLVAGDPTLAASRVRRSGGVVLVVSAEAAPVEGRPRVG